MPYLEQENAIRLAHAQRYYKEIDNPNIQLLPNSYLDQNVFHLFPILCTRRDALREWLAAHGIQTDVHYPIPPHKQQCYKEWLPLSLPITEHIHQCQYPLVRYLRMKSKHALYIPLTPLNNVLGQAF